MPPIVISAISLLNSAPYITLWVFTISLLVSSLAAIFIGIPVIFIFNRLGFVKFYHYAAVGMAISILLAIIFIYPSDSKDEGLLGMNSYLIQYGILFVLSVVVTSAYWLIVRPDRPVALR
jgi:hypothetical protein